MFLLLCFLQIPIMLFGFFNHRSKVRAGAEAAITLVDASHRPISVPAHVSVQEVVENATLENDLEFDRQSEWYYKRSVHKIPTKLEEARLSYYKELPKKLQTARDLARGTREPTRDEKYTPPPTEAMLRAERLKKELRWRNDAAGWEIVRPDAPVAWDERFRDAIRIYVRRD